MEIMDQLKLAEISRDAMKFTNNIISHNPEENANTIYNLKRQMLTAEENYKTLVSNLKKQIKRSELRAKERIQQALDNQAELVAEYTKQIEGLKRQIR